MSNTYCVRMYESTDGKNSTSIGTMVRLGVHTFRIYANTAGEVENSICKRVANGTLPFGTVYQICPAFGNSEFIRSIAVLSGGSFERVFLDPVQESCGEFRRIRLANTTPTQDSERALELVKDLGSLAEALREETPVDSCVTERQET